MAYPQMGNLFPSEAGFKTPGAYEAFLTFEGKTRSSYLAEMDQFFEQLGESKRQFDQTLGFKEKELVSREKLTRESYDLQRELQDEQLEFQRWQTEQYVGVENKKLNQTGMNYLGGPTSKEIFDAWQKNQTKGSKPEVSGPRFYTVDYSKGSGTLRAAQPGELGSQVSDFGQGGTISNSNVSGVSNYNDMLDWYSQNG